MITQSLKIKKIDSLEGLLAIEPIWKDLQSEPCFFDLGSSFEIVRTTWETCINYPDPIFGLHPRLIVLVAYDVDTPVAIAPFLKVVRQRKLGPFTFNVSCIEFVSQLPERFFRFTADIVTRQPSPELTNVFVSWLNNNEKFDVLHLAHIRESSKSFHLTDSTAFLTDVDSIVEVARFPDFDTYRGETYSRRFKNNLRTGINRAKKQSINLTFSLEPANSQTLSVVSELCQLKSISRAFFELGGESFINETCRRLKSEVLLAKIDGQPVAFRIYVYFNKSKHMLDTAIHRKYALLELGAQMSELSIKESFRQRLDMHSEGLWGSWHMYKFASSCPKLFKFVLPGNTFRGNAGAWAVALRQKAIEIKKNRKKAAAQE